MATTNVGARESVRRPHEPLAYPVNDCCRVTGLGRTSVYSLIASGKLETVKICNRRLVIHEPVVRLIEEAANGHRS